jgi:hypothetical protein
VAVLAHENVPRLQVAVKDSHVVHGLDSFQHLLDKALEVFVGQMLLGLDDAVEIAVH